MLQIKSKRNYGIDIARILSMFMVVVLHNLLQGGVLDFDSLGTANLMYFYLENLCIIAVNLFALISGYLMVDRKWKWQKLIVLWCTVIFWSVVTTGSFMVFRGTFNVKLLIKSFFPVLLKQYWYFNGYIVLFLLIPFLNAGFKYLEEKVISSVILALVLLSVTVGFIGNLFEQGGYTAFWLTVMYLVGAWIKKRQPIIKPIWLLMIYFGGAMVSLLGEVLSIVKIGHVDSWIKYNSPIVVVQAIAILLFLSNLKVTNNKVCQWLTSVSAMTFTVYLIDGNHYFYQYVLTNSFSFIKGVNLFSGVITILIGSIVMFMIFISVEYIRTSIMKKIR